MSWRIFTGLIMLYLLIALLSGVMSMTYITSNETEMFNLLGRPDIPAYTNPVGGISAIFSVSAGFISAFYKVFTLDFPIFNGDFAIVRYFLLTFFYGVLVYQVISGVRPA